MEEWLKDSCENIDAGLFSGDSFYNSESLEEIGQYIIRWQKEIINIKSVLAEMSDNNG